MMLMEMMDELHDQLIFEKNHSSLVSCSFVFRNRVISQGLVFFLPENISSDYESALLTAPLVSFALIKHKSTISAVSAMHNEKLPTRGHEKEEMQEGHWEPK